MIGQRVSNLLTGSALQDKLHAGFALCPCSIMDARCMEASVFPVRYSEFLDLSGDCADQHVDSLST